MKRTFIVLCAIILSCASVYSQERPGTVPVIGLHHNTPNVFAIKEVRLVLSPGQVVEQGTLVVRDGLIIAASEAPKIPEDAVVLDFNGCTVYPGFIELSSHIGLTDSDDGDGDEGARHWNKAIHPERVAAELYKPEKESLDAMRKNGFTAAVTCPGNRVLTGIGALVTLIDGPSTNAVIDGDVVRGASFGTTPGTYPTSVQGSIALMRQTLYDGQWYRDAWQTYVDHPDDNVQPESNQSLDALSPVLGRNKPLLLYGKSLLDVFIACEIAEEFNLKCLYRGTGDEYRRIDELRETGAQVIIPLNFPAPPDVSVDEVTLRDLRHWDFAPENPGRVSRAGIPFALTSDKLEKPDEFLQQLRQAVKRGLDTEEALKALTATPAAWIDADNKMGSLKPGCFASFVICDGDMFAEKTNVLETWVMGQRHIYKERPLTDVRGRWSVRLTDVTPDTLIFAIGGTAEKPAMSVIAGKDSTKAHTATLDKRLFNAAFPADSLGAPGAVRLTGIANQETMNGSGVWSDGTPFTWLAVRTKPYEAKADTTQPCEPETASFPVVYPDGAFGRERLPGMAEAIVVRNAVIWTSGPEGIVTGDMLVKNGRIVEVGQSLDASGDVLEIDAEGKHVTPGLIDAHSHLAIRGGINEYTLSNTAETRIADVIDPDDINIYRQLAGGLTTACIIHGSANVIGGQNTVIKLRWGAMTDNMLVRDARPGIKFALGENVRQLWRTDPEPRYPSSRMGVDQFIRDAFAAAKDYHRSWQEYEDAGGAKSRKIPPRRDLRMEPLVEVLDGDRQVQCHSYRQDEILALVRAAEDIGFKVEFLIHVLEGYKVAEELRQHGVMPSTFSDWWAYKFEVYDAIPYNGALMHDQGLLVSFNSDNVDLARRMNLEAAKAVKYGSVPEEEALKFVTINPAIQLGIDDHTGSIEPGKDADFVIWSGHPFDTRSVCEQTWIDGCRYFDINEDSRMRQDIAAQRTHLIQKALAAHTKKK